MKKFFLACPVKSRSAGSASRAHLFYGALFILLIAFGAWKGRDILTNLQTSLFGSPTMQTETESGLVGYWKMNYEGGTVKDYSGHNKTGSITGATAVPGKIGSALSFDGSGDYVSFTGTTEYDMGGDQGTVSAWIKLNAGNAHLDGIVVRSNWAPPYGLYVWDPGNAITGVFYNTSAQYATAMATGLSYNRWYHVTTTYDGSKVRLYVDGAQVGNGSDLTGNIAAGDVNEFTIGDDPAPGRDFSGTIDEVRVYNRALSATEIKQLYREGNRQVVLNTSSDPDEGLLGWWGLQQENKRKGYGSELNTLANAISPSNETNATTSWSALGGISTLASQNTVVEPGDDYAYKIDLLGVSYEGAYISGSSFGLVSGRNYEATFTAKTSDSNWMLQTSLSYNNNSPYTQSAVVTADGEWHTIKHTFTYNPSGVGNTLVFRKITGTTGTLYVSDLSIKEVYDQIMDETSQNIHGRIYGTPTFTTDHHGQSNRAINFNGSTDYLNMGDVLELDKDDPVTYSFWINPDITQSPGIISKSDPSTTYKGWQIHMVDNAIVYRNYYNGTNTGIRVGANTALENDIWTHVTVTYDGSETASGVNMYYNGSLTADSDQFNASFAGSILNDASVNVGRYSYGGGGLDGFLADMRVYNRVLSATEIAELAHSYRPNFRTPLTKGLIGHWPLNRDSLTYGPNMITNSTFESDLSNWTNGGASTYERNTTNPINGTGDLHWVADAGGGYLGVQSDNMSFTSGKSYQTSFLYKKGSGSTLHWNMATSSLPTINNVGGFASADLTATSITEYSGNTTATATTSGKLMFYNTSGQAGEMYVDNVSVREADSGLADLTSNGNDATYTSVSIGGDATEFDGTTSTIPTTLTSNADFQNGFTMSAWIKPESQGEGTGDGVAGRIIDKSTDVYATNGFTYAMSVNRVYVRVNQGGNKITADNAVPFNAWTHVLATVASDATVTNYINGVVSGTPGTTGALSGITTSRPLTIGNRANATDRTFDGDIADVRIWDRVLSATEATQVYEQGRPKSTVNYSADLNGTDQYFTLADGAGAGDDTEPATSDFMLEAWVDADAFATNQIIAAKTSDVTGSTDLYGMYLNSSARLVGKIADVDSVTTSTDDGTALTANRLYHLAVVFDRDGNMTRYVDGTAYGTADSIANEAGSVTNAVAFSVGAESDGGLPLNGQIGKVRYYEFSAGVPSNIANLLARNASDMGKIDTGLQPYLVEAWNLNGDGTAMSEDTGHDLTNNGSTPFVKVR